MKYAVILISTFLIQFTNIRAQETDSLIIQNPVKLGVEKHSLADINHEVFVLWVSEANPEDVTKAWNKTMESGNKAKLESEGNLHQIKGAILKDIDKKKPMNVYTEIKQDRKGVKVFAAFQQSDSTWIDPRSESGITIRTENVMMNIGRKIYQEVLKDKLVNENKKLKELEKNHESNLIEQSNFRKKIQSDSLAIFNNRNEIELKKKEYSTVTDKLSKQRNEIASTNFSSDEAKKEANRKMKEIEKEQKKITKTIEKLQNGIIDDEKSIAGSFYNIEHLKVEETEILKNITDQKTKVVRLESEIFSFEN